MLLDDGDGEYYRCLTSRTLIMIARSKFRFVVVALVAVAAWAMWPRAILSHNPTTTTVLFNREIVAVLQNKCLQCHGDGKMAMSLATYAEARPGPSP